MEEIKPMVIFCERCEVKMSVMGEAYSRERPTARQSALTPPKKKRFLIWTCPKCHTHKDVLVTND